MGDRIGRNRPAEKDSSRETLFLVRRIYRKVVEQAGAIQSRVRALHAQVRFPGVRIDSSHISRNCEITASDGAAIELRNVHVGPGVVIRANHGGRITISNTYIGFNAVIASAKRIDIGPGCLIAEMVVIRDHDHVFDGERPPAECGVKAAPVTIGENVWIASKATVLKGVTIGDRAVVAGSAVVTGDIESRSIYGGVPARLLRRF